MKRFATSVRELAASVGVCERTAWNYVNRPRCPQKSRSRGYDVEAVRQFITASRETALNKSPDREQKILLQCELLREKLAGMRRGVIPAAEASAELREVVAVCGEVLSDWHKAVTAVHAGHPQAAALDRVTASIVERCLSNLKTIVTRRIVPGESANNQHGTRGENV